MRSVLVTGGAGFIGSNLIRHLVRVRPELTIVNLDALTYAGSPENLRGVEHAFVHGDICDRALVERVLREHAIDTIIHLAAETHVDRSIHAPARFVETNVTGTFTLLEAARDAGIARFHHVSTDEVYGSLAPEAAPLDETAAYAPSSPYAASKAAADHLVRAYGKTYGLAVTLSHCSNNYGPYQFPEKLIPLVIVNAVMGEALPVYGDGLQIRDWLHVDDHCAALIEIVERGRIGETYHVAGGVQPTNRTIVETLCDLIDARLGGDPRRRLIRSVTDRPAHDRRYALDTGKIARDLGWAPRYALDAGLAATVDWYLAAGEWLAAIRGRADYAAWLRDNYAARLEEAVR